MVGSAAGVVIAVLLVLAQLGPGWLGRPGLSPFANSVATLSAVRSVAGLLLLVQLGAMIVPIGIFFLILLTRLIVKKEKVAVGIAFVLLSVIRGLGQAEQTPLAWVISAAVWGLIMFVIVRRGLLPAVFTFVYANLLLTLPLTSDFSAWYAGRGWFGILVVVGLAGYGFYISSLAGRPVFADALLEQA